MKKPGGLGPVRDWPELIMSLLYVLISIRPFMRDKVVSNLLCNVILSRYWSSHCNVTGLVMTCPAGQGVVSPSCCSDVLENVTFM